MSSSSELPKAKKKPVDLNKVLVVLVLMSLGVGGVGAFKGSPDPYTGAQAREDWAEEHAQSTRDWTAQREFNGKVLEAVEDLQKWATRHESLHWHPKAGEELAALRAEVRHLKEGLVRIEAKMDRALEALKE